MIVKEYMITSPATITKEKTLAEAVTKMAQEKTNSLIVVDEDTKPVGMVSSRSIIRAVLPDYLEDDPNISVFEREGQLDHFSRKVKDLKVEEFMRKIEYKIGPDDSMVRAAAFSTLASVRTLPVVDGEKKLIGSITRTSIKNAIYNSITSNKEEEGQIDNENH